MCTHSFFDLAFAFRFAWNRLSSLCLCFRTISASIHSAVRQTYYHQMIMSWSTDDIDLSTESWPSVVYMKSSWSHPAAESSWYFCYLALIAKPILIFSIQSQKAKLDIVKSADSKLLKSAVRFCEFKSTNLPKKSETTCSEHLQMKEVATLRKIKFEIIEIKSLLEVSRILTSNRTLNRQFSSTWAPSDERSCYTS